MQNSIFFNPIDKETSEVIEAFEVEQTDSGTAVFDDELATLWFWENLGYGSLFINESRFIAKDLSLVNSRN